MRVEVPLAEIEGDDDGIEDKGVEFCIIDTEEEGEPLGCLLIMSKLEPEYSRELTSGSFVSDAVVFDDSVMLMIFTPMAESLLAGMNRVVLPSFPLMAILEG